MTKRRAVVLIITFFLLIFGISLINLVKGNAKLSVYENRNLQNRPGLESIKKGTFASEYERFYTDQFVFRDAIIKFGTILDILTGKTLVKNIYITKNYWLFPKLDITVNKDGLIKQTEKLDNLRDELKAQGKSFYFVFTPYRGHVLDFMYPAYASGLDAIPKNLEIYTKSLISKKIDYANIDDYFINNFDREKLKSFYFKTDHHWNIDGAYQGFKYVMNDLSKSNPEYKNLKINDKDYTMSLIKGKKFSGSYNTSLYNLIPINEDVPYMQNVNNPDYKPYNYVNGKFVEMNFEDMFYKSRDSKTISYAGTYGLGLPFYKITNDSAKTDKKILIYRDSYQSATALFFADVFKEVYVIDPRYVNDVKINARDMALNLNVDIVMPLFDSQTFSSMVTLMLK